MAHSSTQFQTSIRQLVCAAQAREVGAFETLISRYENFVFKVVFARLGNFHDAEDVAQNVFIEAFLHLHRLQEPAKFTPWLRRLAINLCADQLRRKSIMAAGSEELLDQTAALPPVPGQDHACQQFVENAIQRLSGVLRETMELHYLQNCPLKEISVRLNVPLGTIKRRLHEARRILRACGPSDP